MRDKLADTVRITCAGHVLRTNMWPKLASVLREYPQVDVEINLN